MSLGVVAATHASSLAADLPLPAYHRDFAGPPLLSTSSDGMVIHNPDGHGVFVTHVEPDGVAAKQGIQLGWGLVAINGKAVPDDVSDAK